MSNYLDELAAFWDDFAEDYEAIQQESLFPIAEDLRDFLLEEKIIPCETFLDLAGGTGRYLATIQREVKEYHLLDISQKMLSIAAKKANGNVQLINQAQETFLSQHKQRYNVVFSVMNPALETKQDLLAVCQASKDWCLILRVVKDEDQLFSPYEGQQKELLLNERYKTFLTEWKIPYQTKRFVYTKKEEISRDFFQEYFEEEFSKVALAKIIEKNFANNEKATNRQFLDFELIYFRVPKTYNKNGF